MTTRTTTKPLADCYKFVRKTGSTMVHALWEKEDKTMCGTHDVLEVESSPAKVVSCNGCNAMLKKERQRRSAEGMQRGADRRLAAHFRTDDEPQALSAVERHALILARNLRKTALTTQSMYGKKVIVCTACGAVRQQDDVVYHHEEGCPVILADQVIENYGDRE